jgi:hypothetical protein
MADDIFTKASVTDVYWKIGLLSGNRPKLIRAPFCLVKIPGNTTDAINEYVMPYPHASEVENGIGLAGSDENADDFLLSRSNGIAYASSNVTLEPHETGSWDSGNTDTWKAYFQIGMI